MKRSRPEVSTRTNYFKFVDVIFFYAIFVLLSGFDDDSSGKFLFSISASVSQFTLVKLEFRSEMHAGNFTASNTESSPTVKCQAVSSE